MRRWINGLFAAGILVLLLASLGVALLRPKEINAYENRKAKQFPALTLSAAADGSFQDGVEDALADQVPLAQRMKRTCNLIQAGLERACLQPILAQKPRRYIRYGELNLFAGDYLLYDPRPLSEMTAGLDARRENLRRIMAAHPELKFYAFFVEKDTEVHYETGENDRAWTYFLFGTPEPGDNQSDGLLPMDRRSGLTAGTFEDYADHFYKTDHHWNCRGSYAGYQQVCALLGVPEEERIPAGEEILVQASFYGSKARTLGTEFFTEDFTAYRFDYPAMTVTVNGEPADDYGRQEEFFAGAAEPVTYAAFYGDDVGEAVFDTGTRNRGNLLILGDSFDNAILKLLASHFDETRAVDLRYYEPQMGASFSFGAYVEEHSVDTVLFLGSGAYYLSEDFTVAD